jgi:glucokinase
MPESTRLLADIGGTHARFAWQAGPGQALTHLGVLSCAEYPNLLGAIRHWLGAQGLPLPHEAVLAVATAVQGDAIRLTNSDWQFSVTALQRTLGLHRLKVINDFTALAWALPTLSAQEIRQIGGALEPAFAHRRPVALIGPGTGLGVSGLMPNDQGGWIAISGEGGHVSLPANDAREAAILHCLQQRFGHVSAERVLSGEGLRHLWGALEMQAQGAWPKEIPQAAEISHRALALDDARAAEVIDVFCGMLGGVAGNLVLTLGATGGVFIGGGILPRWGALVERSRLRACFEAKGRFAAYLSPVPIWLINTPDAPALRGAARVLDQPGA